MDERINIYESLLHEKASLEKKCLELSLAYAREFGDDIEALFELKVEAVTLKKRIAYCVKKRYSNESVYAHELEQYVDAEIMEYRNHLEELIEYNKAAKEETPVTYEDVSKIKKLYREIAHLVHPDLHPEYAEDEEMDSLWNKAVSAYQRNDLKSLVEAYDQIIIKVKDEDAFVEDIDSKIVALEEENKAIKENPPYIYKFLFSDEGEIEDLHNDFQKEIADYKEYKESLEKELSRFDIREGYEA